MVDHASGVARVAPSAVVTGRVSLGVDSSVWHGVVIRADTADVAVGSATNIQDGAIIHTAPRRPCRIGDRVTIGHRAVLHGCSVGDDAMIGIGAIVLNGATVGSGAVVAAGAVVVEGFQVPDGQLAVGVPARIEGPVSAAFGERIRRAARAYVERGREQLVAVPSGPADRA